ncbi:hypothetical protein [Catenovulum adriaticum]|uniref:Uncharacterized protein n=1 Tax=Catenovulum adriaticum TaxID=2984846 RepID=A0ABY7AUL5_9ALTE|nr:hypothetical protein [Catenovulum sp. TS8]WAJ72205.1 hypothetical protein OLW01_18180 [Catenovulum sp. TS8]
MAKEGMKFASEANFKSFMQQYGVFKDLDDITVQIPSGVQIADYVLRDVAVLELKTIKSDPGEKLESYFHEIMKRPDFPGIYGELNFRKVVGLMDDGERLIRKFENKAFRQIESVVSKADKQVNSTIEYLSMSPDTAGVLVLINEAAEMLEPDILINYISGLLGAKSGDTLRFKNIHRVILLQDTHMVAKPNSVASGTDIPIYNIKNDNLELSMVEGLLNRVLEQLIGQYSKFNGFKHRLASEEFFSIEKIMKELPCQPNGQELIEANYRKNRYMKDYSEQQLIEFGSTVMSIVCALFMKNRPFQLEHERKMYIIKKAIELFEESRIRPFDLKKLNIDPVSVRPVD